MPFVRKIIEQHVECLVFAVSVIAQKLVFHILTVKRMVIIPSNRSVYMSNPLILYNGFDLLKPAISVVYLNIIYNVYYWVLFTRKRELLQSY